MKVACDRGDGTLNIHDETETCNICSPNTLEDFPEDVTRLLNACRTSGLAVTRAQVQAAWEKHSAEVLCGWENLDGWSDAELVFHCTEYL